MENRIVWIDYAKTFGIFLVILAHTPLLKTAGTFIYVFHMPLFFFISGYLFSYKKYTDYKSFVVHRFKQLIIPYFFFNILTYLFWFLVGSKFGNDSILDIEWYLPILGMFYAKGSQPWLIHCIPLWFICCLFIVENLYYIFFKGSLRYIALILFLFIGYLDHTYNQLRLPWSFNIAFFAVIYYAIGNFLRLTVSTVYKTKTPVYILLCLGSFLTVYIIALVNGKISMHTNNYGNIVYFYLGGFAGILGIYALSINFSRLFNRLSYIEYISNNTITILAFHLIAGSLIKGIVYFILRLPLNIFEDLFWINLAFSILSLILIIPIIYTLNRWAPHLIGK